MTPYERLALRENELRANERATRKEIDLCRGERVGHHFRKVEGKWKCFHCDEGTE